MKKTVTVRLKALLECGDMTMDDAVAVESSVAAGDDDVTDGDDVVALLEELYMANAVAATLAEVSDMGDEDGEVSDGDGGSWLRMTGTGMTD